MPNRNTPETPGSITKVWVVEESYIIDDDGDWAIEIVAVHASEEGARGNLTPDYKASGHMEDTRHRVCYRMDLLP